ncbi:MAG: hypothetical protein V7754_05230 [Halioglobus sp.]
MKVVFSHGKESGPWGSKIRTLADIAGDFGCSTDSLDYQGIPDPDERALQLIDYLNLESEDFILVGSSMGGYVSLVAAKEKRPLGVFLLAPALYIPGYSHQSYSCDGPVQIVHGWSDNVIPVENSIRYAKEANCTLHLINGDHRLNSSLDEVVVLFKSFLGFVTKEYRGH